MERELTLVSTASMEGLLRVELPGAPLGLQERQGVIRYRITGIPEGVSDARVVHLATHTIMVAGYTFAFGDLGEGKIVGKERL